LYESDVPLRSLRSGAKGTITVIAGPPDSVHRLEEMGFRRGLAIEVIRSGSPCIVRIDGRHRLCVRDDSLASVLVRPGELPSIPHVA
jgi:ferrous iron transport protein A